MNILGEDPAVVKPYFVLIILNIVIIGHLICPPLATLRKPRQCLQPFECLLGVVKTPTNISDSGSRSIELRANPRLVNEPTLIMKAVFREEEPTLVRALYHAAIDEMM